jgi:hypothetical protein
LDSIKGGHFFGQLNDQKLFKTGPNSIYLVSIRDVIFCATKGKALTENVSDGFRRVFGARRKLHNRGYIV